MNRREKISSVMQRFYNVSQMNLEYAKALIRSIEDDLITILPEYQVDGDYRLGNETYGYSSDQSILDNLNYISDRWGAAFRIIWTLGIINENYR